MLVKLIIKSVLAERIYSGVGLTNGRNSGDDLSELKLVQNSSLTSCIETYHENSHLFLSKKPAEKLGERQPHFSQLQTPTNAEIRLHIHTSPRLQQHQI